MCILICISKAKRDRTITTLCDCKKGSKYPSQISNIKIIIIVIIYTTNFIIFAHDNNDMNCDNN